MIRSREGLISDADTVEVPAIGADEAPGGGGDEGVVAAAEVAVDLRQDHRQREQECQDPADGQAEGECARQPDTALHDQSRRVLQPLLDRHQELHRLAAIDDPMIIRQREVHHWPDYDLAIFDHGAFNDVVHAEDGALWGVQDRRRQHRTENSAVGDREGTAGQFLIAE